jgi:hypothetical protein
MLACIFVSVGRFRVLAWYGQASKEYAYLFYYSDVLLTVGLYFALISLYAEVFEEMDAERNIRFGALVLLFGTALFSLMIIAQAGGSHLSRRFFVDLSQNLYFVGLILTYVLWGAILKMRETRSRLIQLVLSLGIFFSLFAASFAISSLYPGLRSFVSDLMPLLDCILPVTWLYAFWRTPDDARLAPGRLTVVPR